MIFTKKLLAASAAFLVIAACGGGNSPESSESENTVENPAVSAETSSSVAATPEPDPALEFAALPAPYNEADYARGRRTFKLCQACHQLGEDGVNLVGPKLFGIFGRPVGTVEGFRYSQAINDADFIWTPEKLDEWLVSPNGFLPGNNMAFTGVRRPEDRVAVIAYIMAETGYGETEAEETSESDETP